MTLVRSRLIAFTVAMLVCQGTALSAAPGALCRDAFLAAGAQDECCSNTAPGQICPMHHKSHGVPADRGPAWTCICSPSDAVFASVLGAGVLPAPVLVQRTGALVAMLVPHSFGPLEFHQSPTSPPPRLARVCHGRIVQPRLQRG
ncbi:MAG: hypothetical protein ACRD2I_01575 [Vicinamibacterales bacterium]